MSIIERIVVFGFRLGTEYLVAKLKYMMSRGGWLWDTVSELVSAPVWEKSRVEEKVNYKQRRRFRSVLGRRGLW